MSSGSILKGNWNKYEPVLPFKSSQDSAIRLGNRFFVSKDSTYNPFDYTAMFKNQGIDYRDRNDLIGELIPAQDMLMREQLYATSLTPKGRFVTWVAIQNSFRNGWIFVREKRKNSPLPPRLHDRLIELTETYNLKEYFTLSKSVAATFGQSFLWKRQINPRGMKAKFEIRSNVIWEEHIEYNDAGIPSDFRPVVWIGKNQRQFDLTPNDGVLWLNHIDPFGNNYQGFPELIPVFRTIKRSESVAQNYAEIITQKGMGHIDIKLEGVYDQQELLTWAEIYKKLLRDSVIVHGEDMTTTPIQGINSGYNYPETQRVYYEDFAAGTGYPQMRIRGVQTGTVTGSSVDQDNIAEIYSGVQESSEPYMKRFYIILDPDLEGKQFEIEWEFDIKLDKGARSAKMATDMNTVLTGAEILTVNQAFKILEIPLIEGDEGNLLLQEWIDQNFGQQEPLEIGKKTESIGPSPKKLPGPGEQQNRASPRADTFEYLDDIIEHDSLKEFIARRILDSGIGNRPANRLLKNLMRSGGMSFTDLTEMKKRSEKD